MCLCTALLFRFPASRRYVVTFSKSRRARVVVRRTLCHQDEWRHHPTSLWDETLTMVGLGVIVREWLMRGVMMITGDMDMIMLLDTAVVVTAFSDSSAKLQPITVDPLFSRQIWMDSQSGHLHHELIMTTGLLLILWWDLSVVSYHHHHHHHHHY